ncbi:MAG TPA: EndoU domain-containing protein [Candidatus Sericytochromatia bacterium]
MPPFSNPVTISVTCLALGMTSALLISRTQAQVPPTGTFTATQACPATQAINGKNPGNIKLTVGVLYAAEGFNSPQRQFVLLEVPQVTPDRRWVKATCGDFQASGAVDPSPTLSPVSPTPSPTNPSSSSLLPFFDTEDNPVSVDFPSGAQKDISPPPPELEEFDRRILALCGAEFNAPVSNVKFRQLMTFYPDVVRDLKQVTDGELKPNRRSNSQFLDDLTAIWFEQKGFKHIFCGEQDGKSIGGLHFVGRYLEFQQNGVAGRILRTVNGRKATQEVVDGEIYTFGVAIVQNGRVIADNPVKGYPYTLNAQEMLLEATRGFKLFKSTAKESKGCLLTIAVPGTTPHQAVFVKKAGAIRTFYPDATPDTNRNGSCDQPTR